MKSSATENREIKYVLVFNGYVPGILKARVAYRRTDRQKAHVINDRKIINCPYCSKPLTDIDINAKVRLYHNPTRRKIRCHVYPVCQNCNNAVGIVLT